LQTIAEKKAVFNLPYHKNQVEYWGIVNHDFSDSFLSMTNSFLKNFLIGVHSRHHKEIFSAFVELVQNVAEYSQAKYKQYPPPSYFSLVAGKNAVNLITSNQIKEKAISFVTTFIDELLKLSKEELKIRHKEALLEGKSLGLILIIRMKNAKFDYEIQKDHEGIHWLTIETTIHYEFTED